MNDALWVIIIAVGVLAPFGFGYAVGRDNERYPICSIAQLEELQILAQECVDKGIEEETCVITFKPLVCERR